MVQKYLLKKVKISILVRLKLMRKFLTQEILVFTNIKIQELKETSSF
jgi:hypothetical protein